MMPLIGITTYRNLDEGGYYLPAGYVESVRQAGGVPLLITPGEKEINRILQTIDGIIFAGGGDIDPTGLTRYGIPLRWIWLIGYLS
jgi:putative glutamine amidotransferase